MISMGYAVVYDQKPLHEFDFTVKNLAVDLRDGVRLCRLIDLHCPVDLCDVSSLCCLPAWGCH